MATRTKFRCTLSGLIVGVIGIVVLIGYFTLAGDKTWPLRLVRVFAWGGLWALDRLYRFPVPANPVTANGLLF